MAKGLGKGIKNLNVPPLPIISHRIPDTGTRAMVGNKKMGEGSLKMKGKNTTKKMGKPMKGSKIITHRALINPL